MMTATKSGRKIIGIWTIVCILAVSVLLIVSLIHPQKVYADKKKITGTAKLIGRLTQTRVPIPKSTERGMMQVLHSTMNSADPDWNNARLFFVRFPTSVDDFMAYGVITHPNGEQTFIEYEAKYTSATGGSETTGETNGFFLKGTGKFENIRARWKSNWKWNRTSGTRVDEWTVEYF